MQFFFFFFFNHQLFYFYAQFKLTLPKNIDPLTQIAAITFIVIIIHIIAIFSSWMTSISEPAQLLFSPSPLPPSASVSPSTLCSSVPAAGPLVLLAK